MDYAPMDQIVQIQKNMIAMKKQNNSATSNSSLLQGLLSFKGFHLLQALLSLNIYLVNHHMPSIRYNILQGDKVTE